MFCLTKYKYKDGEIYFEGTDNYSQSFDAVKAFLEYNRKHPTLCCLSADNSNDVITLLMDVVENYRTFINLATDLGYSSLVAMHYLTECKKKLDSNITRHLPWDQIYPFSLG